MRRNPLFRGTPEELRAAKAHWAQVFRDNAERWWRQQGHDVPSEDTPDYTAMYTAMYNAWVTHMRHD
jgi:hypothetical protein